MISRRSFVRTLGAASAVVACPAIVRGQNLNSRLQIAGIGCDGKGYSDLKEMSDHKQSQLVGLCDVDLQRTERARELAKSAPVFQDYRQMLSELGDKVDAVTVSTPDHMHAIITLQAMRQGKHVYCQKPLTHNVWEARQIGKLAADSAVVTRLGNQIHSHMYYRTAVSALRSGLIGKVKRVHSWSSHTGHGKSGHISLPKDPPPAPKSLNWDLWIGVAPMRTYGGNRVYHPWGWRDWQDFGNGALGDFGCHIFDPVFTGLEINNAPLELTADHTGLNDQVWPAQTTVQYVFPGTKWTTDENLPVTWYDGGRRPSTKGSHLPENEAIPSQGSLLIGERGTMVIPHVGRIKLYPQEKFPEDSFDELPSLNHYHGWVDGCISGEQPSDGFVYGAKLTESVLLGNIGVRHRGETLKWNEQEMSFEDTAANNWLTREYRDGWAIQAVG